MKLFIWRGSNVLVNYSSGIAGVMAPDVETARELLRPLVKKTVGPWSYEMANPDQFADEEDFERLTKVLAFLNDEPEVYTEATAFLQVGGE